MALDHEAIRKAYPDASYINDETGAFKADGTKITLVQSKIDAARVDINNDYKPKRAAEYPSVVDQLDLIYHSGVNAWKAKIKETKDKYPKP
jgi:hypothetical protein